MNGRSGFGLAILVALCILLACGIVSAAYDAGEPGLDQVMSATHRSVTGAAAIQSSEPVMQGGFVYKGRVTQADREAAASMIKEDYDAALLARDADQAEALASGGPEAVVSSAMNPGGVPHYYGPEPNWANSPMPKGAIASVTLIAGGSGYFPGNTTVNVTDVYGTGSGANVTANVTAGFVTALTLNSGGTNYTAPRLIIESPNGTGADATASIAGSALNGGIRKFVDTLPGLGIANANNNGLYIPVAIPDTTTYPAGGVGYTSVPNVTIVDGKGTGAIVTASIGGGKVTGFSIVNGGSGYTDHPQVALSGGGATSQAIANATVTNGVVTAINLQGCDYYEIELGEFNVRMHSDLPNTTLRGYRQVNTADPSVSKFCYLGPLIIANRDRPVRVKFTNNLPTGAPGNMSVPVDFTVMGAGMGPLGMNVTPGYPVYYTENRATLHLHGGNTPWISDGTPYQWTTPSGELTDYPKGESVYNVPDMPNSGANPPQGILTFYYTNQQSSRLMFYHDHAHGITRLNVYVGEAAGYLLTDQVEQDLILGTDVTGVNPDHLSVLPDVGIPLVIQDRTFVDADTIPYQDPTWNWGITAPTPRTGDLWYPHVFVPAQNPALADGTNPFGRWPYGPWFWPPTQIPNGPVANPYYGIAPYEYSLIPGTPNPSAPVEAFMDTMVVNGALFPNVTLEPKTYRLRILNAADDRFLNLMFFEANSTIVSADGRTNVEVSMVPATPGNVTWPADWPTDARPEGVPDPATKGPDWIVIGTEGGFLPAPVVVPAQPTTWVTDPTVFNAGNVDKHSLLIGPAERMDVVVDFSAFRNKTLILWNDAPAAFPARDPRYDYFAYSDDLTDSGGAPPIQPGYAPNTRTIMQIRINDTTSASPYDVAALNAVFEKTATKRGVFEVSQDEIIIPESRYDSAYFANFPVDQFVRIFQFASHTFLNITGSPVTYPVTRKAIQDEQGEAYDTYGRPTGFLGLERLPVLGGQNLMLYGYTSPPVEVMNDTIIGTPVGTLNDGTQLWKITHNGVDTHPIHWHLANMQVINRVGWDGIIRPPEETELGWKDTVRISPLEDTIVAVRETTPSLPFDIPNSIRAIEPAMPLGAVIDGGPGGLGFADPVGEPVTVINHLVNYGWEYVWHCHILAHEEMDMMHSLIVARAPRAPVNLTAVKSGQNATLNWTDNSADETHFGIENAASSAGPWTLLATIPSTTGPQKGSTVTYTVVNASATSTWYRVYASNLVGDITPYAAPAVGWPHYALNSTGSVPANLTVPSGAATKIGIYLNGKWWLDRNGNGIWNPGIDISFMFGASGRIPVTGDWNGTGITRVGTFTTSNGRWALDTNGDYVQDTQYLNFLTNITGTRYPVTGDWNGSGKTRIGLFRPSNGRWYLDVTGDGIFGPGDVTFVLGGENDRPVTGDWLGTGVTQVGFYRTTNARWSLDTNGDRVIDRTYQNWAPNQLTKIPVTGDWTGNGTWRIGHFRAANANWVLDVDGDGIYAAGTDIMYTGFLTNITESTRSPVTGKWA